MAYNRLFDFIHNEGFMLLGVAAPLIPDNHRGAFNNWLECGYHGGMSYMTRHSEKRLSPKKILPQVRSVIVMAVNYNPPQMDVIKTSGLISKYAYGRDYHNVLSKPLKRICRFIEDNFPSTVAYGYTDTGPVLEKVFAVVAGLGFIGKNTLLITPEFGSWVFLSVILTNIDIPYSTPSTKDCGRCRLCIDACPTGALIEPYILDSRKCISYLTIEHRGEFPVGTKLHNYIFGCDICQNICPHNTNARVTGIKDFHPEKGFGGYIDDKKLLGISDNDLNGTSLKRAGLEGLKRNMRFL